MSANEVVGGIYKMKQTLVNKIRNMKKQIEIKEINFELETEKQLSTL